MGELVAHTRQHAPELLEQAPWPLLEAAAAVRAPSAKQESWALVSGLQRNLIAQLAGRPAGWEPLVDVLARATGIDAQSATGLVLLARLLVPRGPPMRESSALAAEVERLWRALGVSDDAHALLTRADALVGSEGGCCTSLLSTDPGQPYRTVLQQVCLRMLDSAHHEPPAGVRMHRLAGDGSSGSGGSSGMGGGLVSTGLRFVDVLDPLRL